MNDLAIFKIAQFSLNELDMEAVVFTDTRGVMVKEARVESKERH